MTISAGLQLSMMPVTGGAVKAAVHAGVVPQLFYLFLMTGQTWRRHIASQKNLPGRMGITVTVETTGKVEMGAALMAGRTGRHDLHVRRRMALMTLQAERRMGQALALEETNHLIMAFGAVIGRHRCPYSLPADRQGIRSGDRRNDQQQTEAKYCYDIAISHRHLSLVACRFRFTISLIVDKKNGNVKASRDSSPHAHFGFLCKNHPG